MKKFGMGKKGDGDEDSSRLALFGSRAKSKSPAPPAQNPYAPKVEAPPDPYTQAKMNAGLVPKRTAGQGPLPNRGPPQGPGDRGPPSGQPQRGGYGGDNRYGGPPNGYDAPQAGYGAPRGGYGAPQRGGYGASQGGHGQGGYRDDKYGNQNAYGEDRYGNKQPGSNPYAAVAQPTGASRYGPGGYGGLGRTNSNETATTDDNRDALFGGARARLEQKQQDGVPPYEYNPATGAGGSEERSYGAYGDRQLTAEEEEEEDVTAAKQEIRFMKQQDVASTRNALRIAQQAEETGRNTLALLGSQGERIHNTEKNLDIAANHSRDAEEKARELKTLNRSMWAVHVNNPFGAKDRAERRDHEILEKHRAEKEQREATRESAYKSNQRMEQNFRGLQEKSTAGGPKSKGSLAERAKYQFEADSEDDEMENEIDSNLDALSGAATRLNLLGRAMGEEVEAQNRQIIVVAEKTDKADDHIVLNTDRLRRIR